MVNEQDIIKYDRTDNELQELVLFLVAVAGKNANTTAKMLDKFLSVYIDAEKASPYEAVKYRLSSKRETMEQQLKHMGFGCQTRLARAFKELANSTLNLRTCTRDELLAIHGIGLKSANCFISWTRKGTKMAMLDTHLMKFIRFELGHTDAPIATPSSKKQYEKWEKVFLDYCEENNLDPTEEDLRIWRKYSNRGKKSQG
jgi:thermostable 8-oxoguanine DNA glycosylase